MKFANKILNFIITHEAKKYYKYLKKFYDIKYEPECIKSKLRKLLNDKFVSKGFEDDLLANISGEPGHREIKSEKISIEI